jgi:polyisoprenoid-binding protein YceI
MKRIASLFIMFVFAATAFGQTTVWKLDKVHSNVMFTVRHLVVSEVTGSFGDFTVNFVNTKEDFSDAGIDAVIQTASINTQNERRDAHLKSDDFFNAEKFPEMKFKSTSLKKVADNKYELLGDLTIRDITKPVKFDVTHLGVVSAGQMGTRSGWKATTTINRFDFNLKWDKTIESGGLIVGQDVTIQLNLELVKG